MSYYCFLLSASISVICAWHVCYPCGSRGALCACLRQDCCASHALHELSNCPRRSSGRCADMKAPSSGDLQPARSLKQTAGPFPNCAGMDAILVLCFSPPPPQLFLLLRSLRFPPLLWVRSLAFSLISELILLLFIAGNQHLSHTAALVTVFARKDCIDIHQTLWCSKQTSPVSSARTA